MCWRTRLWGIMLLTAGAVFLLSCLISGMIARVLIGIALLSIGVCNIKT